MRRVYQESPLGLRGPPQGEGGLHRGPRVERAPPLRAVRSCQRWLWPSARPPQPRATGTGKPSSSPAAPITSSCFCLALRGSVCPNPRPLTGLHLLPPLPPLPFPSPPPPPASQRPGPSTPRRRPARRFRAPGCCSWGREREG